MWPHGCSGHRRARPPARSPHASLRLGVVDLEARPCPPVPPAPSTPVAPGCWRVAGCVVSKPGQAPQAPRRPPIGRVLVRVCLLWPCRRPPAPRPGPSIPQDSHPVVTSHVPELTPNFACNSPATLSNLEIRSLELQRFQTLLKLHLIELHARLLGSGFVAARGRRCLRAYHRVYVRVGGARQPPVARSDPLRIPPRPGCGSRERACGVMWLA